MTSTLVLCFALLLRPMMFVAAVVVALTIFFHLSWLFDAAVSDVNRAVTSC